MVRDERRVRFVAPHHPCASGLQRAAVAHVPLDEPSQTDPWLEVHEPGLVEQRPHLRPRRVLHQEVVALRDHQGHQGSDGDGPRDGLLDGPVELGCVDDVRRCLPDPAQEGHETGTVERVRCTLAVGPAQPRQLRLGEVVPVHGQVHRLASERGDERHGQRRLASPGWPGDAQDARTRCSSIRRQAACARHELLERGLESRRAVVVGRRHPHMMRRRHRIRGATRPSSVQA